MASLNEVWGMSSSLNNNLGYSNFENITTHEQPMDRYADNPKYDHPAIAHNSYYDKDYPKNVIPSINKPYPNIEPNINNTAPIINDKLTEVFYMTVYSVAKKLQIQPSLLDISKDGKAIWKHSQIVKGKTMWRKVFNEVVVFAERIKGKKPIPHIATLTTVTKIKLDPDVVKDIQIDLPQICYCEATQQLYITMDSLERCLALLTIISGIQQKKLSINKVRYYNLYKKYLELVNPREKRYNRGAKYSMIRFIFS